MSVQGLLFKTLSATNLSTHPKQGVVIKFASSKFVQSFFWSNFTFKQKFVVHQVECLRVKGLELRIQDQGFGFAISFHGSVFGLQGLVHQGVWFQKFQGLGLRCDGLGFSIFKVGVGITV